MTDSSDPDRTDGGFDDPTAPPWSNPDAESRTEPSGPTDATPPVGTGAPTQPIPAPAPPVEPFGAAPFGQGPAAETPYPPPTGYGQARYGEAPYGQLGPAQTPYGQQPYGSTAYGQQPYSLPPAPYGPPPQNGSALALTIVSAIGTVLCCLLCLPSLILGIVALSKHSTDPNGAARLARWGWFALAGAVVLVVVGILAFFALGVAGAFDSGTYDYEGV